MDAAKTSWARESTNFGTQVGLLDSTRMNVFFTEVAYMMFRHENIYLKKAETAQPKKK